MNSFFIRKKKKQVKSWSIFVIDPGFVFSIGPNRTNDVTVPTFPCFFFADMELTLQTLCACVHKYVWIHAYAYVCVCVCRYTTETHLTVYVPVWAYRFNIYLIWSCVHACLPVNVFAPACLCVHACGCGVCVCVYVPLCVYMPVCVCVYVRAYVRTCLRMCMCVCACTCLCVCVCVCVCRGCGHVQVCPPQWLPGGRQNHPISPMWALMSWVTATALKVEGWQCEAWKSMVIQV